MDNTAMAIFKFDCFIPYCCFFGIWDLVCMVVGCLFTDWHGEYVELGYPNDSNSYIYF
jgi:hypothetical protein